MTRWQRAFWVLWTLALGAKFALSVQLPLFGDEAFYWLESRAPALAYDDVPGMTPWLIALGTWIGGHSTLAVRMPFLLVGALTAWWLMRMATRIAGPDRGAQAGVLALLVPLFAVDGLLALPDVPLTFAIVLCADALVRLADGRVRVGCWLLAAGLALGWLSHYRFVVAAAAGGGWLLFDPSLRRLLRRPVVWLAGLGGCAAGLAPLLWQQSRNAGAGLRFQFVERHPWQFHADALLDPLWQATITTPLLFGCLLAAMGGALAGRDVRVRALGGCAALLLGGYFVLGLFADSERARLHWPLPGYLVLCVAAPAVFAQWTIAARRWLSAAVAVAAFGTTLAFGYLGIAAWSPAVLADTRLYPYNFVGWNTIATEAAKHLAAQRSTVLIADNFMLAAQLEFAFGGTRSVYSLDHPSNRKHGRQAELQRRGRDGAAALQAAASAPVLVVLEESATALRARPHWYAGICTQFPAARIVFDTAFDHGRKRMIGLLQQPGAAPQCAPPAAGYVDAPLRDPARPDRWQIRGWAVRAAAGIDRIHALVDGVRVGELTYGQALPTLAGQIGDSGDPNGIAVGYAGTIDVPAGAQWLQIEAESADGARGIVASVRLEGGAETSAE